MSSLLFYIIAGKHQTSRSYLFSTSGRKICGYPGCSKPGYVEPSGRKHDYCGKKHAEEHKALQDQGARQHCQQQQQQLHQKKHHHSSSRHGNSHHDSHQSTVPAPVPLLLNQPTSASAEPATQQSSDGSQQLASNTLSTVSDVSKLGATVASNQALPMQLTSSATTNSQRRQTTQQKGDSAIGGEDVDPTEAGMFSYILTGLILLAILQSDWSIAGSRNHLYHL